MPTLSDKHLRKLYKRHYQKWQQVFEVRFNAENTYLPPIINHKGKITYPSVDLSALPEYPDFPEECRGMMCGAKTRAGTPCKLTNIYENGRCKFHGGLSTGPKTVAGKAKVALNGLLRQKCLSDSDKQK